MKVAEEIGEEMKDRRTRDREGIGSLEAPDREQQSLGDPMWECDDNLSFNVEDITVREVDPPVDADTAMLKKIYDWVMTVTREKSRERVVKLLRQAQRLNDRILLQERNEDSEGCEPELRG